jgi:glycosyltransferase involved in cell wall biosynthesis
MRVLNLFSWFIDKNHALSMWEGISFMPKRQRWMPKSEENAKFAEAEKKQSLSAMQISVVIITYNEERNIERCLQSVQSIADEVIVLDSGSTDMTEAICKRYHVRFLVQPFLGHVKQKNAAAQFAKHPYLLSLDADEALSEGLIASIIALKTQKEPLSDGYQMNRLNYYAGKWIKYGGWYPDRKLRLWRKESGLWAGNNPHDIFQMHPETRTSHLKGDLLHYSYSSIEEHRTKTRRYAEISANSKHQLKKKATLLHRFGAPILKFIQSYVIQLGFLEGRRGFAIAFISAAEKYWKYQYLHKLRSNAYQK